MEFVLIGDFIQPKGTIERLIRKMGGKVITYIHKRCAAVISNMDEVQKMGNQMDEAFINNIQVISENFLNEIQNPDFDPIAYIISESICEWGGDVSFWKK